MVQKLLEFEDFDGHCFASNIDSLLLNSPESFKHEFLTNFPVYAESLQMNTHQWFLTLKAVSKLKFTDLEHFCVIARVVDLYPVKLYEALREDAFIFKNLYLSPSFNVVELLSFKQKKMPLFFNKKYRFFVLAFLEYLISEQKLPFVFDSTYLLIHIARLFSSSIDICNDELLKNFAGCIEDLPKVPVCAYDYYDLEIPNLTVMITNLIKCARKLKSEEAPKRFVKQIQSIVTLFKPQPRIWLIYKLSEGFQDDDHVLGVFVGVIKEAAQSAKVAGENFRLPKALLMSFSFAKESNILEQFDRHSCLVNFLIYLKITNQFLRFNWTNKDTRSYIESMEKLIAETRKMIVELSKSSELNEMSLTVQSEEMNSSENLKNSEESRKRVLTNIDMFEFSLNSLKHRTKKLDSINKDL